jgi:hypothetical protein
MKTVEDLPMRSAPAQHRWRALRESVGSCVRIAGLALAIVVAQVLFLCGIQARSSLNDAYLALRQFDTRWYCHIMIWGYRSTIPPVGQDPDQGNVAFFPGYPRAARALYRGLGVSDTVALLLAAQFACWGFWTYLLMMLKRWRVPRELTATCLALLATHPAAFFLVVGYSESLFLFSLLGFLFWGTTAGWRSWVLAALHGFVMTATRLVGLGLCFLPLLHLALTETGQPGGHAIANRRRRRLLATSLQAGVASLGGLLFFGYCQWHFGYWDLYLTTERIGWGTTADYVALLRPRSYRLFLPNFTDGSWPNDLSPLSVPLTVVLGLVILLAEARLAPRLPPGNWRERAALYFGAAIQFYISASGSASRGMSAMLRYNYGVHVLLLLAVVHLATAWRQAAPDSAKGRPRALAFAWSVAAGFSLMLQALLVRYFCVGHWVA